MKFTSAIITVLAVSTLALGVPQKLKKIDSPTNIPYEELVYILNRRNGVEQPARTLTPCARAILGCCAKGIINEKCSEQLGCGALFFDDNPCDNKFILAALAAARAFYEQFDKGNVLDS